MALSVYRLFTRARPALSMKRLISPQSGGAQDSLGRCFARFQGTSSKLHESPTPESKPISRFPIPDRETLPEDIQRIMKEVEKQSGFLPNIFKIMSYDPKSFKYFFGYYDHLISDRGNLTKEDKSFISLAVSTENKCVYCTVSHRMVFRLNTNDPGLTDQMTVNWQTADLTDRQRAILELAMAVTKNEPITDEHFTNLERHGLDQRDAFDIGHYAAFFALANRLSTFTKLRPNDEFSDLKSDIHQLPKTHQYSLKNIGYSYLQQDLSGI